MCKMCDTNRMDWEFKTIDFNGGDFGKYEMTMGVTAKGIEIQFSEEQSDPIMTARFKVRYCPFCGGELGGWIADGKS